MTSETPNLHASKNLNLSVKRTRYPETKEAIKTFWKCSTVAFKICCRGTLTYLWPSSSRSLVFS